MKKYTIHYDLSASYEVEVIASTKEEALTKAARNSVPLGDYNYELDEVTVSKAEEIDDMPVIIAKAEQIIKKADEEDVDFKLSPWPYITAEVWNGSTMEQHKELMDLIYWDYDADEIGFNTSDSGGDFTLSELPEIEQYNVCQSIIAQAVSNNIQINDNAELV